MRIIAGKYRSRKLITLEGLATRPTLDQTKEAIFSSLGGYINDFVILDVFGGSGSTLIACEQLNRKCYMMELDPHYIDVIIKRWEDYTGNKSIKLE